MAELQMDVTTSQKLKNTINTIAGKLITINNAAIKALIDAHTRLTERLDAFTASSFECFFFF